ncbi:MAG: T9SS type A sorting domain-containing protein, partial [Ignavibacteriae bacterium]|nr:T9SS type A sorting domain-containing protein [Ignavibacteriota bacterium]
MKKISIISLTVFLLILKSIPIYSQVVHFKGNIFYDINRKIDSIRIQNTGKNIDTLLINTDSIDLSTLTKLNDDNSDNGFEVSDIINPDKSFFLIRNIKDDIIDVVISDILGKKIFQKSYFIKSGENQILIDFNEYYDGLYFISFYGSNKIITKRLLIADDIFINNNFIQNPSQQQKKVFIQSADNYNFIGYSGNCIPDTISNVTPINNYTYKFYFILDTNLLPAKRIHLEFNLPNTVFKDWWHYSYPPDVNMLDT